MKPAQYLFSAQIFRQPFAYVLASGLILLAGLALSLGEPGAISPWLRVSVALLVFVLPGAYLFLLLPARDTWDAVDVFSYGFAYSIAAVTLLGLAARFLFLSIDQVEAIWHGLAALGFVAALKRARGLPTIQMRASAPVLALLAILLLQAALFVRVGMASAGRTDDRDRHHAVTNNFLRDDPLGWAEPYYETGNLVSDRMYLTYWVFAQALVVEVSGVPILLARYLIQPFVIIVSIAAIYSFARNLGQRARAALLAPILSLLLYSMLQDNNGQTGSQFLIEAFFDKSLVGFMLAPLAISSAYLCRREGHRRAWLGFGLTMFAATCVHALVAGFAVVAVGLWCLLQFATSAAQRRYAIQLGALTLLIFSPAILSRLTTVDATIYNFGGDAIDRRSKEVMALDFANPLDGGQDAYMIHPAAAGDPTYILLALVLLAMLVRRFGAREKLVLAIAATIGIGLLPISATLYGSLVSVYHILRVLWLLPYGYLLYFVLETGWLLINRRAPSLKRRLESSGDRALIAGCLMALLLTGLCLERREVSSLGREVAVTAEDRALLEMAEYIEAQHDERVWIAASPGYRERPISMTWKAISLSRYSAARMAHYSRLTAEQAAQQEADNIALYSGHVSIEDKFAIIDRYGIDYLLFEPVYAHLVYYLYEQDRTRFEQIYSSETLHLVRVR